MKVLIAVGRGWLLNCFLLFFAFLTMKITVLRTFVYTVKVR